MDGSGRGRQPPLQVVREFAGFRLEQQVLVRVYELVVPEIRRTSSGRSATSSDSENQFPRSAKGA